MLQKDVVIEPSPDAAAYPNLFRYTVPPCVSVCFEVTMLSTNFCCVDGAQSDQLMLQPKPDEIALPVSGSMKRPLLWEEAVRQVRAINMTVRGSKGRAALGRDLRR